MRYKQATPEVTHMMKALVNWLVEKVKDYVLRNPRTTVVAIVGALVAQIPALAPFKEVIITTTLMLIGILSKDAGTTGTTALPREPVPVPGSNLSTGPVDPTVGSG